MAFTIRASRLSEPFIGEPERVETEWRDRVVTGVATSIAVLIVATVAVLMGMA